MICQWLLKILQSMMLEKISDLGKLTKGNQYPKTTQIIFSQASKWIIEKFPDIST